MSGLLWFKMHVWAGEMHPWLRGLAALPHDLTNVCSQHLYQQLSSQSPVTPALGNSHRFLVSTAACTHTSTSTGIHTLTQPYTHASK